MDSDRAIATTIIGVTLLVVTMLAFVIFQIAGCAKQSFDRDLTRQQGEQELRRKAYETVKEKGGIVIDRGDGRRN